MAMKSMISVKKELVKAEDICSIIKACKNSGITELVYGDLHLVFGGRLSKVFPKPLEHGQAQPIEPKLMTPEEIRADKELQAELDEQDELEQMAITNPLEYERRLAEGSLEDENA